MYIPKDAQTLEKITETQIRLGIQGSPKTGKTFAATTFPNCIFLNLDRGLGAHAGRKDVMEIPFWDDKYIDSLIARTKSDTATPNPPNRRDALIKWLMREGQLLEHDQTLVIDGSTDVENAFDAQESLEPVYTKTGKIDDFAFWRHKVEYFAEFTKILKTLKCHVIYICHETPDRNKEGELNGKLRPMLTGQFGDKLASQFTDWFRQQAFDKPSESEMSKVNLKHFGCSSIAEFKELLKQWEYGTMYVWQTESDNLFNAGTSSLVNPPRYIPANYTSFLKYKRTISSASVVQKIG